MSDYSHYDHCRTRMMVFQKNHSTRLVLMFIIMIVNCYFHLTSFGVKYAGAPLGAYYAAQGENNTHVGSLLRSALFGLLPLAGAIILLYLAFRTDIPKKRAFLAGGGLLCVLCFGLVGRSYQANHLVTDSSVRVSNLPFGMGVLTILLSLTILVLTLLASAEHPRLNITVCALLAFGTAADMFNIIFGILLLLLSAWALKDAREMAKIMKLPGYPYFSERFDEQQKHSDYEPLHTLDHRRSADMLDAAESAPPDHQYKNESIVSTKTNDLPSNPPQMDYTLKMSDDPAEMPGIDDIFEHVEPLPEPELPEVGESAAPDWETPKKSAPQHTKPISAASSPDETRSPAESGFPETTWDMPETSWDIPDIADNIPDLPDIPDIPKL